MQKILRGDKAALAVIVLVVTLTLASALPGIPHQFWGTVKDTSGNSAPDGILVIAKINGQDVAAGTTAGGSYGLGTPQFYAQDPDGNRAGKTIEFFVKDVKVAEYSFQNGGTTELNLVYTGSFATQNTGGTSSGSSSGGSFGGGGSSSSSGSGIVLTNASDDTNDVTLLNYEGCTEDWECSDWMDCVGGIQKRVCTDKNSCGTESEKPTTQKECSVEIQQEGFFSKVTGAAIAVKNEIAGSTTSVVVSLIILVGIIFGIIFIAKRGDRKSKN